MIKDADGNELTSLSLTGTPGSDNPFSLPIECRAGYKLTAVGVVAGVTIRGKANPGDAFQNLETTPIDLNPYAGTTRTFYFDAVIDSGAAIGSDLTQIIVEN
jgi:hypothetical protein